MSRPLSRLFQSEMAELNRRLQEAPVAPDYKPVPSGRYNAILVYSEMTESRSKRTPGCNLRFEIVDCPSQGQCVWRFLAFTEAALPYTRRDLQKLGVTDLATLDRPLPRFRCVLDVVLRTNDDGAQFNEVRNFEVVGVEPESSDPFAPPAIGPEAAASPAISDAQSTGDAPAADNDPESTEGGVGVCS